jgi:predicted DCC family thiol-disulfide oxidoreductase YuxK
MLRLAPLQGAFAQVALRRCGLPLKDFESLVFLPEAEGKKYHLRTEGVIAALARLGGGWRVAARFIALVPTAWRDVIYNVVAGARYRIFGRVVYRDGEPSDPKWAQRFLT